MTSETERSGDVRVTDDRRVLSSEGDVRRVSEAEYAGVTAGMKTAEKLQSLGHTFSAEYVAMAVSQDAIKAFAAATQQPPSDTSQKAQTSASETVIDAGVAWRWRVLENGSPRTSWRYEDAGRLGWEEVVKRYPDIFSIEVEGLFPAGTVARLSQENAEESALRVGAIDRMKAAEARVERAEAALAEAEKALGDEAERCARVAYSVPHYVAGNLRDTDELGQLRPGSPYDCGRYDAAMEIRATIRANIRSGENG